MPANSLKCLKCNRISSCNSNSSYSNQSLWISINRRPWTNTRSNSSNHLSWWEPRIKDSSRICRIPFQYQVWIKTQWILKWWIIINRLSQATLSQCRVNPYILSSRQLEFPRVILIWPRTSIEMTCLWIINNSSSNFIAMEHWSDKNRIAIH